MPSMTATSGLIATYRSRYCGRDLVQPVEDRREEQPELQAERERVAHVAEVDGQPGDHQRDPGGEDQEDHQQRDDQ